MEMWFTVRDGHMQIDYIIYGESIFDCYVKMLRMMDQYKSIYRPTIIFACTAY